MSNSTFNVSPFRPIETKHVLSSSTQMDFTFSSAYATGITVELWSEEGSDYSNSQTTSTDGQNDSALSFTGFPPDQNLISRITVTGEDGSENSVYVSINW